jgi:hypothetical protein
MICNPETLPEQGGSVILSHIQAELAEVCGSEDGTAPCHDEVARAIQLFLENEAETEFVDARTLTLMAAQALKSLGQGGDARRLILFGSGMVRPSEWVVTGDQAIWVLNLKDIALREDASLEIIFFKGIQVVLDSIADVWDASGGDGIMGLKHVFLAASSLLGAPRNSKAVQKLCEEIREICIGKLQQIGRERGWHAEPFVLNLDF